LWITDTPEKSLLPPLTKRIIGRLAAIKIVHPKSGEKIVDRNEEIDERKRLISPQPVSPRSMSVHR